MSMIKDNDGARSGRAGVAAWAHGIVAMAGYWEPLAFRRRQGAATIDDESHYAAAHSETMAKRLAEIGINAVVWHGYKGLGFEFEEQEMEQTRQFGRHCRAHGIHLGAYCNLGSFFAETFFQNKPEAREWLTIDQHGQPHQYSEFYRCYYRYRPCMTHAAFADYVARMAVYLVEHVGSEWIAFDNNAMMPCYCANCRQEFIAFLNRRYPTDTNEGRARARTRFGYDCLQHIELPRGTARMPIDTLPACHEPVLQEWVAYRCELLTTAFQRIGQQLKATGRQVAICVNPPIDQGEFVPLVWGNEVEDLAPHTDYVFSEDDNAPRMEDGRLIGHFPTYKFARAMQRRAMAHQFHAPNIHRALIEAAVHNRGCLGHVGWAEKLLQADQSLTRTLHFIRDHAQWYVNRDTLADVAILRGRHALVNNWCDAYQSLLCTQQCLYRYGIQYDLIIESKLDDLARYRAVVLPNVISLPDAALERISRYVQNGGALLVLEQSGTCDGWGRLRKGSSIGLHGERDANLGGVASEAAGRQEFAALMGLDANDAERVQVISDLRISGRFRWRPNDTWVPSIDNRYWLMPENADAIVCALCGLLRRPPLLCFSRPGNLTPQLLHHDDGSVMLHLINYEDEPSSPMALRLGMSVERAGGYSLDGTTWEVPVRSIEAGLSAIDVPSVDVYAAIRLQLTPCQSV